MKIIGTAVCASVLLLASGCGKDTHESVTQEMMASLQETIDLLKSCKDEASAKAAEPKLKAMGKKMEALKKRADALGKPSKEQDEAIKKKFGEKLIESVFGMMGEMARIEGDPKMKAVLKDSMGDFGSKVGPGPN